MKIVISGSACTGKTTLAKALAERTGATCVAEGFEPIFEREPGDSKRFADLLPLFMQVLDDKHAHELALPAFVADRGPADVLAFWLGLRGKGMGPETTEIHNRCAQYMAHYDRVVIPPFGIFPMRPKAVGKVGQRVPSPWVQLRSHALISGLVLHLVGPRRLLQIPRRLPPDQWCDFVLEKVKA